MKPTYALLYGIYTIGTGLLRSIEAQAYKPNSLYFCFVMGALIIASGFLHRLDKKRIAGVMACIATLLILGFYLTQFIGRSETEANLRVGGIIIASVAFLSFYFLPQTKALDTSLN